MNAKHRILIVEDDDDISMIEQAYLEASGFETFIVNDGDKVLPLLHVENFDLILLDLMLPGKNGYEICKEIRGELNIPILMVTARTESVDKIRGLGLGADDYIAKPFDPAELVARVNANIRQYSRLTEANQIELDEKGDEILIGNIRVLLHGWKVYKGEQEIRFPNREFELLKLWLKILILFSRRNNCLKKYGDMIMLGIARRLWCILIVFVKKLRMTVKPQKS